MSVLSLWVTLTVIFVEMEISGLEVVVFIFSILMFYEMLGFGVLKCFAPEGHQTKSLILTGSLQLSKAFLCCCSAEQNLNELFCIRDLPDRDMF